MFELKTTLISLFYLISTALFPTENFPKEKIFFEPQITPSSSILYQTKKSELKIKNINLESIFSSDHSWLDLLPKDETITLITTGDVIPARTVNWKMSQLQDFTYPFLKTVDFLRSADITLINLEAPLISNCPLTNQGMVFCGNQRFLEGLKFADIDVVNLANNHTLNWGKEGLCQTVELLTNHQILISGLPDEFSCNQKKLTNLTTKNIKGFKLGFLGFNFLDQPQLKTVLEALVKAKKEVDFLIVSCHWGAEYQRLPAPTTVELAHQMIEAGADLIVGNHPHWYQPLEIYQDKLIIYAHGNFIFDQEWSLETKTGFLVKHTLYRGKLIDSQIFPIFIENYSQPYFLEGKSKEEILNHLKEISS